MGRNDFQVKINGQRIELGEIENAIANIDGVVQCAVIVREQYICAFYTGAVTDIKDFRNILSATLPRYMVPHSCRICHRTGITPIIIFANIPA